LSLTTVNQGIAQYLDGVAIKGPHLRTGNRTEFISHTSACAFGPHNRRKSSWRSDRAEICNTRFNPVPAYNAFRFAVNAGRSFPE
jgi:hypothetical protein